MFKPKGPFCQSCGMPLAKDAHGGGTLIDGSRSIDYCSHCYELGKFKEPHLTLEDMKAKVKNQLKDMYIPAFLSSYFTKDMHKLKRWTE